MDSLRAVDRAGSSDRRGGVRLSRIAVGYAAAPMESGTREMREDREEPGRRRPWRRREIPERRRFVLVAGVLLLALGALLSDWLPTGVLHDPGALGADARGRVLRWLSSALLVTGLGTVVLRGWIAAHLAAVLGIAFISLACGLVLVAGDLIGGNYLRSRPNPNVVVENLHVPHDRLGWVPKPGAWARHAEDQDFDVSYEIDADGFKAVPNRGERRRALYLFGDSYTFGHGAQNRDTFANIMAAELLAPDVHVFNAGVNGWGLVQMYARFLEVEDRLQAGDLVLFTPTAQDVKRNLKDFAAIAPHFNQPHAQISRYPNYVDGELTYVDVLGNRWLQFKSYFFKGMFTRGTAKLLYRAIANPSTTGDALDMVDDVRRRSEARNARFALFFLPLIKERRRGYYEEDVTPFDYHDLREFFPADGAELLKLHFPTDRHWNRSGHEIAARAIVETLRREGLLESADLRGQG